MHIYVLEANRLHNPGQAEPTAEAAAVLLTKVVDHMKYLKTKYNKSRKKLGEATVRGPSGRPRSDETFTWAMLKHANAAVQQADVA